MTQHLPVPLARRVKVTLGISALGAVAGGVAGGISALVAGAILTRDAHALLEVFSFVLGAEFGAPLGAVLLPVAAWTLMRHVSFGRAAVGTVAGTVLGGIVGWGINPGEVSLWRSIAGGIVGFAIAAILLRVGARTRLGARTLPGVHDIDTDVVNAAVIDTSISE